MHCAVCGAALPLEAHFCPNCGARVEPPADSPPDPLREALEQAIGFQYRVERLLGRGGMGAVYLAHELALDRDVAIKVLPPEQARTPELRERFRREARTAARLGHPNIVPLHTFGEVNGLVYFVMGFVEGESLASRLRREGPLPSDAARALFAEVADALDYAHRHGVVHRDIKPDNILIDAESGSPRLTDFGIARAAVFDAALTTTGQAIGTPAYMSPEQVLGRSDIDARSDLYSLGVALYETVSGRRPFESDNVVAAMTRRLTEDPEPLRAVAPEADDDLSEVVHRCLQRNPERRWPDAKSLGLALVPSDEDDDDSLAVRSLRLGLGADAALALALVYVVVFAWLDPGRLPTGALVSRLAGGGVVFFLMAVAAAIVLRRQGLDLPAVARAAFRQPRVWRFWYPRRFRRRGDVWDRLPAPIRRVRRHFAWVAGFVLVIYVPVLVGLLVSGRQPAIQFSLEGAVLAALALLFAERRRAARGIAATLGTTMVEASKIVNAPSWRTGVWQRGPGASLIRQIAETPGGGVTTTAATTTAAPGPDAPTR